MDDGDMNDDYVCVSQVAYGNFALSVDVYERDTERAVMIRTIDEAHERNVSGEHRFGFCRACADLYTQLQSSP